MSDYEADCLYLGKPVDEDAFREEWDAAQAVDLSGDNIERLFLGLPLLAA